MASQVCFFVCLKSAFYLAALQSSHREQPYGQDREHLDACCMVHSIRKAAWRAPLQASPDRQERKEPMASQVCFITCLRSAFCLAALHSSRREHPYGHSNKHPNAYYLAFPIRTAAWQAPRRLLLLCRPHRTDRRDRSQWPHGCASLLASRPLAALLPGICNTTSSSIDTSTVASALQASPDRRDRRGPTASQVRFVAWLTPVLCLAASQSSH